MMLENFLDKIILDAKEKNNLHQYDYVVNLLEKIIYKYNNNEEILFELAKAYYLKKDNTKAQKYLCDVIELNEKNIYAMDLLAKICIEKGDFSYSIKMFKKILKINKNYFDGQIELVKIYFYHLKDYKKAVLEIAKITDILKNSTVINYILAVSYMNIGLYDKAKKYTLILLSDKNIEKINIEDVLKLARLFVTINEYWLIVDICNSLDFKLYRKQIIAFYDSLHSDISKHFKKLNISNNSFEQKKLLELGMKLLKKIPKNIVKIRNIILNEIEIYQKKIILKSKPRSITVVLTNKCNLKCIMCDVWKNSWYMNKKQTEQIKSIMPYLEYITWHGGEVFLHDSFWELFEYAHKNNVEQEIITNGILIEEKMIKKFIDYGIQLTISIDSIKKDIYEKIRIGADFNKIISVLELFKKYRQIYTDSKMVIKMNVIVDENNYKELGNFVDFAHNFGIDKIYFFPLVFDLNKIKFINIYSKRYGKIIDYIDRDRERLIKKAAKFGIQLFCTVPNRDSFDKLIGNDKQRNTSINNMTAKFDYINYIKHNNKESNKNLLCIAPWQRLRIDKYVVPYCFCMDSASVGIVNDDFDIEKIWNGKYMKMYRQMIKNNDFKDFCNPVCYANIESIISEYQGTV